MLKTFSRHALPAGLRHALGFFANAMVNSKRKLHLALLRKKVLKQPPGSLVRFANYGVTINDGPNFYVLYKYIFVNRIYHFEAQRSNPLILDCGSNIGMSILYFKKFYPKARIIGFEPDPAIYPYAQKNIEKNSLSDVQLVQAALAGQEGNLTFHSDGKYSSSLATHVVAELPREWKRYEVPCVRLRHYLTEPVDFLKMNIEGTEWEVLADSDERLRQVREMVIEYHHLPGLRKNLHKILTLLNKFGFQYLVNDFDSDINRTVHPPFRLTAESSYYLLIYAKRMD
jgi:FkbM family methyltransferase